MKYRWTDIVYLILILLCPLTASCQSTSAIHHTSHSLIYDENTEQAKVVRYELNRERIKYGDTQSRGSFKLDPKVATRSASSDDYNNSDYDRGHLAPFSSFRGDQIGSMESFYMSNVSPQLQKFNRVFWVKVENMLYGLLDQNPNMVIFTGPIFIKNGPTISVGGVSVPHMFFKVAFNRDTKQPIIGILVPHEDLTDDPSNFIVPVTYIEYIARLNFTALEKTLKR